MRALILAGLMAAAAPAAFAQNDYVTADRMLDVATGRMIQNPAIIIRDGVITDVGARDRLQVPSAAEVIELLKGKFAQYSNFYITDTESLTVEQVSSLRRHCFNKQVEMKVAKNTLIKKALESLDAEKYAGVYDSLHKVTALMFSENPKDPAVIISSFRKETNNERPVLKAAFINGDVFVGNDQLKALTQIKTKNELIGQVINTLLSPVNDVTNALSGNLHALLDGVEAKATA